jgi:hypothetical protein
VTLARDTSKEQVGGGAPPASALDGVADSAPTASRTTALTGASRFATFSAYSTQRCPMTHRSLARSADSSVTSRLPTAASNISTAAWSSLLQTSPSRQRVGNYWAETTHPARRGTHRGPEDIDSAAWEVASQEARHLVGGVRRLSFESPGREKWIPKGVGYNI